MTPDTVVDASRERIARIAGAAFLLVVVGYTLTWTLVYARLIVAGNVAATTAAIAAHEPLFRIGIAGDLVIAIGALTLAWALYVLLKPVNGNLALLALLLKSADVILALVTVSATFIALQILPRQGNPESLRPQPLRALVGLSLDLHAAAATLPTVLTGLGFIVFFFLLFKSRYVPRILAGFGIFSYSLLLLSAFAKILAPQSAAGPLGRIELFCYAPSVLFELLIGLWLIFKGVNLRPPSRL